MFRALGKSKIALVLAILFGISLFFFRGGSRYSNLFNSDNIIASVSGTSISTSKFNRVMQLNVNQYTQILGKKLTGEEIQTFQIHTIALQNLINNAVFENEFENKSFVIDESVVAQKTKERIPSIYDKNNQLNDQALNNFLKNQNLKIEDLVNIIDYETRSRIFDNLFFETSYPNKINQKINYYNNHIRKIDLINFKLIDYKLESLNLQNKKEIEDFYNKNIDNYMSNEMRDVSYILIDKSNFAEQFRPNDQEIKNYYSNNKKLFIENEKRDFTQFNFKNKNDALNFKNNTKGLQTKEIIDYANKNKIIYSNFKELSKNEVLEDLSSSIFKLNKDEISDVVETPLAKHIIIINDIKPEIQRSFEDTKVEISNTLLNIELNNFYIELKNKISQEILNGFSLNEISNSNSLKINKLSKIDNKINNTSNDFTKNEIIRQSFIINKDFVSDLIDIDQDKSFILNVENVYSSKPLKIEEVFDIVSKDYIKFKKIESIKGIIDDDDKNISLESISKQVKTKIQSIELEKNNNELSKNLINNLFNANLGEIIVSFSNDEANFAMVNEIFIPKDQQNNSQTILLNNQLKNAFGNEIIKTKNISTNESLLNALLAQY